MIDGSMLPTADVVNPGVIFHIQHILFLFFDCDSLKLRLARQFKKYGRPNPT